MKHVSIFVRDCAHLTTRLVLHLEISLGTKTQRRESRLLNPTRLSVSVPTNAVLTKGMARSSSVANQRCLK